MIGPGIDLKFVFSKMIVPILLAESDLLPVSWLSLSMDWMPLFERWVKSGSFMSAMCPMSPFSQVFDELEPVRSRCDVFVKPLGAILFDGGWRVTALPLPIVPDGLTFTGDVQRLR